MMMKLTCPECGNEINQEECVDTQFWDDTYYDTMIGECSKCGQRYLWTDVYTYNRTEDLRKIEDN